MLCGYTSLRWDILVLADGFWKENKLFKATQSEWVIREAIPQGRWYQYIFPFLVTTITLGIWSNVSGEDLLEKPAIGFDKKTLGPRYIETTRSRWHFPEERKSLFELVCSHLTSKATDPRDKLYALVGIGGDTQHGEFGVDYNLTLHEVEVSFANFMIHIVKSLDFVCLPMSTLLPRSKIFRSKEDNLFWKLGLGSSPGGRKNLYTAAGSTLPRAQLVPPLSLLEDQESQEVCLQAEGIEIDEVAASLNELSDLATFQPWSQSLRRIPILNRSSVVLAILSALFIIMVWILQVVGYLLMGVFWIWQGGIGCPSPFIPHFGQFGFYIRIKSLDLPETDRSFPRSSRRSSEWIEDPNLIQFLESLKNYVYLSLKTSGPSSEIPGTRMNKDERISSLYRTLIGNRTLDGNMPPPEWRIMFDVLLYGPSRVPDDFHNLVQDTQPILRSAMTKEMNNTHLPSSSDVENISTADRRAQMYVQPLIEAISRNLSRAKLFITKGGRLGIAKGVEKGDKIVVLLGCSFLVLLRSETEGVRKLYGYRRRPQETDNVEMAEMGRILTRITVVMHDAAYLDGFMEGRGIQEWGNGLRELVTFGIQ